MRYYESIVGLIGNTPLVRLRRVMHAEGRPLWALRWSVPAPAAVRASV